MKRLPYGRQEILQDDIDAVVDVLRSDLLTQGPVLERFESALVTYCGANHAVAVNSATAALHVACLALDLAPGKLAWTTPNTFVASANCVRLCGAEVDFVDIDPDTYNLCATALERKLEACRVGNKATPDVVIVVHFAGQSCDMKAIKRLAEQFDFRIIEDASHAIGGRYDNIPIGACTFSDITVFSFHPVKVITTGEGGAALCNSKLLHDRMALYRTHGVRKKVTQDDCENEPWRYIQDELGLNYRLTDIHAALGISQLQRLDTYVQHRHKLAERYQQALKPLDLTLPHQAAYAYSAYHLYPVLVGNGGDGGAARLDLYNKFVDNGVGVNVHYIPVHTQPYYRNLGHQPGDYPIAERYYERSLTLPLFGSMTTAEQDRVIQTLYDSLGYRRAA